MANEIITACLAIECNSMEDLHAIFETPALPIIKELRSGNSEVLKTKMNLVALCSFMGHQLTRTKSFKDGSLSAIKGNAIQSVEHQRYAALTERNWWFISFILGINVADSLYILKDKENHLFISNNTKIPFITCDNPVINIHSSLKNLDKGDAPEFMDLYFPISPNYAYMINESSDYNSLVKSVNEEDVKKLNSFIAKKSYKNTYGNSKEVLELVRKLQ